MGVPVVSSDVGGQRDLVDNTTGALIPCLQEEDSSLDSRVFPEEELKNFTDAIVHLLVDKDAWEAASRNCRERIETGFTIQKMVNRLAEELIRVTEDPFMAEQRSAKAKNLQQLEPLAAEMYVAAMEAKSQEALLEDLWRITHLGLQPLGMPSGSLIQRVKRVWKEEGSTALVKKSTRKIIRIWKTEGFSALARKIWTNIYWKLFRNKHTR